MRIFRESYGAQLAQKHSSVYHPSIKSLYNELEAVIHNGQDFEQNPGAQLDTINDALGRVSELGRRYKDQRYLAPKDKAFIGREYEHLKGLLARIVSRGKDIFLETPRVEPFQDHRKLSHILDGVFNGSIPIDPKQKPHRSIDSNIETISLDLKAPPQLFSATSGYPKTVQAAKASFAHSYLTQRKSPDFDSSEWLESAVKRAQSEILINGQQFTHNQKFSPERVSFLVFTR